MVARLGRNPGFPDGVPRIDDSITAMLPLMIADLHHLSPRSGNQQDLICPSPRGTDVADVMALGEAIDRALAAITDQEKAEFAGRMHLLAMRHRHRVIRKVRQAGEVSRGTEMSWVVLGALLGFLERRVVTQKSLAAAMAGALSPPTLSRAIRDAVNEGWLTTRVHPDDVRLRVIEVSEQAIHSFVRDSVVAASWEYHTQPLRTLRDQLLANRPAHGRVFGTWLAERDRWPVHDKALIVTRLHVTTFERLVSLILAHRRPGDFTRAYETLWIILEAILVRLDGDVLTQKQLVAAANGLFSPATISRAVHECTEKQWIVSARSEHDSRVLQILPADRALAYFYNPTQVASAWQAYFSLFVDRPSA